MNKKTNRKIRIYLKQNSKYYPFCWVEFLQDNSFSFGLSSKKVSFTEFGSAIYKSGKFINHKQTITKGNVTIKNAKAPHVTFHPPKISQKSGIVNFTAANGKVDTWPLSWFPVRKKQLLACITVKDFYEISNVGKPRKQHKIVPIQNDLRSFRMNIEINPRNTQLTQLHDSNALSNTNIHGYSPNYILSLRFYRDNSQVTSIYMASDTIIKA